MKNAFTHKFNYKIFDLDCKMVSSGVGSGHVDGYGISGSKYVVYVDDHDDYRKSCLFTRSDFINFAKKFGKTFWVSSMTRHKYEYIPECSQKADLVIWDNLNF